MKLWKSVVGKLWMTIIVLVAVVLMILGIFLLEYIDITFTNSGDVKKLFIYISIMGFFMTTFFAFFLSTKITQPLIELKKAADQITEGNYHTRVLIRSSDEIGELAKTFNHMTGRLEETIKDLQHEKEHLGSILRSMSDAVITLHATGNVMLANPHGEKLVREWNELSWEDDRTEHVPEPLEGIFNDVLKESKEMTTKIHVRQDVFSVVMTPLYSNNMIRGAVAVLRDVTEEVKLDKLRKDFVANVSHELRTPLAMLQGYSEALLDDIAGSYEERRELAQVINDETMRMGRLVQNLLDLARMEAGHMQMNCTEVDVSSLVLRTIRKFTAMAKEEGITIQQQLYSSQASPGTQATPGTQASQSSQSSQELKLSCADEDRLEQVLTNLIDNAIRHSPRETGEEDQRFIFVRANPSLINDEQGILIEVEDQGEGIPKEDLPYVFERFYKADKARTREGNVGTGLGLSIVKNIVEAHEGTIQVHSTLGKGTTFSFMIPLVSSKREKAKT
ncbi:ATP-binding protein [Marinicrinis sediminis]|uniref:histidine kinase n=1 Tax=Marinicrinis sediminis TaxID=1652465 RepID=A0ABW5RCW5_9BACL